MSKPLILMPDIQRMMARMLREIILSLQNGCRSCQDTLGPKGMDKCWFLRRMKLL